MKRILIALGTFVLLLPVQSSEAMRVPEKPAMILPADLAEGVNEGIAEFVSDSLAEAVLGSSTYRLVEVGGEDETIAALAGNSSGKTNPSAASIREAGVETLFKPSVRKLGAMTFVTVKTYNLVGGKPQLMGVAKASMKDETEAESCMDTIAKKLKLSNTQSSSLESWQLVKPPKPPTPDPTTAGWSVSGKINTSSTSSSSKPKPNQHAQSSAPVQTSFGTAKVMEPLSGSQGTYQGELAGGRPYGFGKATFADGTVYSGCWKNGRLNGRGKATFADGRSYDGNFVNNTFSGQGTLKKDNWTYVGGFKSGVKEGQGRVSYNDGSSWTGPWKNDMRHGRGIHAMGSSSSYLTYQFGKKVTTPQTASAHRPNNSQQQQGQQIDAAAVFKTLSIIQGQNGNMSSSRSNSDTADVLNSLKGWGR